MACDGGGGGREDSPANGSATPSSESYRTQRRPTVSVSREGILARQQSQTHDQPVHMWTFECEIRVAVACMRQTVRGEGHTVQYRGMFVQTG